MDMNIDSIELDPIKSSPTLASPTEVSSPDSTEIPKSDDDESSFPQTSTGNNDDNTTVKYNTDEIWCFQDILQMKLHQLGIALLLSAFGIVVILLNHWLLNSMFIDYQATGKVDSTLLFFDSFWDILFDCLHQVVSALVLYTMLPQLKDLKKEYLIVNIVGSVVILTADHVMTALTNNDFTVFLHLVFTNTRPFIPLLYFYYKFRTSKLLKYAFFGSAIPASIIRVIYIVIVPPLFITAQNDLIRAVLRLFLHPLLIEVFVLQGRIFANWMVRTLDLKHPEHYQFVFQVIASLYGRLLIVNMESPALQTTLNFLLAFQDAVMRAGMRWRDYNFWYRWKVPTAEAKNRVGLSNETHRLFSPNSYHVYFICDEIAEMTSIVVATMMIIIFRIPTNPNSTVLQNTDLLILNMILALFFEVGMDLFGILLLQTKYFSLLGISHTFKHIVIDNESSKKISSLEQYPLYDTKQEPPMPLSHRLFHHGFKFHSNIHLAWKQTSKVLTPVLLLSGLVALEMIIARMVREYNCPVYVDGEIVYQWTPVRNSCTSTGNQF